MISEPYAWRCHKCGAGPFEFKENAIFHCKDPTLTLPKSRIEAALREAWMAGFNRRAHTHKAIPFPFSERDTYATAKLADIEGVAALDAEETSDGAS